jgi:hypothetical protein
MKMLQQPENRTRPLRSPEEFFERYDHLGNPCPYYSKGVPGEFHTSFATAVSALDPGERTIDPAGAIEVLNKGYLLGNRTLVQGVRRSPWMGRPGRAGAWEYAPVPAHGQDTPDLQAFVTQFKSRLHSELRDYVSGRGRIGLLLSGGMDSRMLAGLLRELQLSREFAGDVVAFTWGLPGSRDVTYAQEIARRYAWDWIHIPLGPETLRENVHLCGLMGAEFPPFHLHGMRRIRESDGLDAVIAASYGDSVGRGEFSGRWLRNLKPILPRALNRFGLVKVGVLRKARVSIRTDAWGYRRAVARDEEYQYREIEQQMHYMRRLLQGAMGTISEVIPFFQLYTAPATFGAMWALDTGLRRDAVYSELLQSLPGDLRDIPWARTGRLFGMASPPLDLLSRNHHAYGRWLRTDLRDEIRSLAGGSIIRSLGVFNAPALDALLKIWPLPRTITTNAVDWIVSWLASLAVCVEHYCIQGIRSSVGSPLDYWEGLRGLGHACSYLAAREIRRK